MRKTCSTWRLHCETRALRAWGCVAWRLSSFAHVYSSRLGCCIELTSELDGITVRALMLVSSYGRGCPPWPTPAQVKLPSATRNFYVDGHVPQPH